MAVAQTVSRIGAPRATPASAAHILLANETLRTVYLLGHAQTSDPAALTDERAAKFLLWFAFEGWRRYPHVVFSPAYLAFLAAPMPPCATRLAAYALMSRADVRARFKDDLPGFHDWYYANGAAELGVAPLVSAAERAAHEANDMNARPHAARGDLPGVNVIGFGGNVMGIGEDVRALAAALGHAGAPRALVNVSLDDAIGASQSHGLEALCCDRPIFPVNIFALPPFETARLRVERGPALFHGRYNIGYWPWELTTLPEHWRGVFDLVDEIWAPSDFLVDVYRKLTRKPVRLMPPYLNILTPEPIDLASYSVEEEDVVFLTMFDFNSFIARKNPEGAIAAFRRAFPFPGGEKLIIKTINSHARPDAARRLSELTGGDPRCIIMDRTLTRAQTAGLIVRADCLVSLHRAEGFGRVIAEAMALGVAVISTNWSGSTSFVDATRGFPVSYKLRDVAAGEYAFHHGGQWAEPSIEDAIAKLQDARARLGGDRDMRARARAFVESAYGLDTVAAALGERLAAISAARPDLQI
ncbi:glycosyltransferase [Terrarubrum flagellatum]|uniref:glycosyltransferase n=1 Tax=Terrirubrum flagellatum TaxID=2895980 RepID=UPI0031454C3B